MDVGPNLTPSDADDASPNADEHDQMWRRPGTAAQDQQPESAPDPEPEVKEGFIAGQIADVKKWFAGLQIQQIWHVVAVAVVLATAGFGGMDTVAPKSTTFQVNQSHSTGELTMVIKRAVLKSSLSNDRRVVFQPQEHRLYLAVVATVTNNGVVPEIFGGFGSIITPVGIPYRLADPAPVIRMSDATPAVLQPAATDDLAFIWNVADDAIKPGMPVTFRLPNRSFGAFSVGYGQGWVDSLTYADITVPVAGAA
ncbi:MAG: hypothetical protein WCE30_12005 [Mycobacterium sp.]